MELTKVEVNKVNYILFEDPGHSWLRVPLVELEELGISEQITGCSWKDEEFAYLEEDRDMSTYLRASGKEGFTPDIVHPVEQFPYPTLEPY